MVVCVVVNWNGWRDTLACLQTLALQDCQPLHVVVVDNGSTDESVARITDWIDSHQATQTRFHLLPGTENLGFARGANLGIQQALQQGAEHVWLLNNDTECPPDTLRKLLCAAKRQPDAGIVGSVLYYQAQPHRVQAWGGGWVSRWTGTGDHYTQPTTLQRDSYVTFASVLIRAEVLQEVGLLYDGYFMYYDDSDYCLRLQGTRWKLAIAADTAILHKESASTEGPRDPFMERTVATSGVRFLRRHSPAPWLSVPVFVLLKILNRARRAQWAACRAVLSGAAASMRE